MTNTNTKYTTATEEAAKIRAAFRAAGFSSREISVRARYASLCSEISVTIRTERAPMAWVRAVAEGAESIDRCEITGEILNGCNRYVHVDHDADTRRAMGARYEQAIADAVATLEPGSSAHADVAGLDDVTISSPHSGALALWIGSRHCGQFGTHPGNFADMSYRIICESDAQKSTAAPK